MYALCMRGHKEGLKMEGMRHDNGGTEEREVRWDRERERG